MTQIPSDLWHDHGGSVNRVTFYSHQRFVSLIK
jgi:hypothetical protein